MRIVNQETRIVPIDSIQPSPENVNEGDVGVIAQSVEVNGWYGSVLVQTSTGHIIAGEHRWKAAKALGAVEVPVTFADVDEATARRIRLADTRTTPTCSPRYRARQETSAALVTTLTRWTSCWPTWRVCSRARSYLSSRTMMRRQRMIFRRRCVSSAVVSACARRQHRNRHTDAGFYR
jgi:hypothetical protein